MTHHLLDDSATTNEAVGIHPDARDVEQRLAAGFILLDKQQALRPTRSQHGQGTCLV